MEHAAKRAFRNLNSSCGARPTNACRQCLARAQRIRCDWGTNLRIERTRCRQTTARRPRLRGQPSKRGGRSSSFPSQRTKPVRGGNRPDFASGRIIGKLSTETFLKIGKLYGTRKTSLFRRRSTTLADIRGRQSQLVLPADHAIRCNFPSAMGSESTALRSSAEISAARPLRSCSSTRSIVACAADDWASVASMIER